jgi:hypothetical protein
MYTPPPREMTEDQRKEYGKLKKIWDYCLSVSKICLRPNCSNSAIKSHWLQQQGILSNITAEDGHLIQYSSLNAFSEGGFERKSAKKSAMLWFPGFCGTCDKQVFSLIEDKPPVFTDFKQQILFSYRTLLNKLREIELICDVDNQILLRKDEFSSRRIKFVEFDKRINDFKLKALHYYKYRFDNEIHFNANGSAFSTAHVSLPKVDIAATILL